MCKRIKIILAVLFLFLFLIIFDFLVGFPPKVEKSGGPRISWGINFSQKQAELLGLDWKETYLALLEELGVRHIKLATYWDLIEPEKDNFNFLDLDWQIKQAESRDVKILLVIGRKTPRWPECHLPWWAKGLAKEEQQERILNLIEKIVLRYIDYDSLVHWQVENEPLFSFGDCPWQDENFLAKEISLVKSLDQNRQVLVSASGEWSNWQKEAKLGDIVGITMYRKAWFPEYKSYLSYPFPPSFYWLKAKFIDFVYKKPVIVVELQAEPWGPKLLSDSPLEEQEKTMNLKQFQKNISFAKKTGFDQFYLWGAEWWFWTKEKQNDPAIWNETKKLFENQSK